VLRVAGVLETAAAFRHRPSMLAGGAPHPGPLPARGEREGPTKWEGEGPQEREEAL
jgi:hypothetical protein